MKTMFSLSLIIGASLLSTTAGAVTTDGNGTHQSSFIEGTFSRDKTISRPHVHKVARAAAILTYHEGVNKNMGDKARELRRLDEKNNRGRAVL